MFLSSLLFLSSMEIPDTEVTDVEEVEGPNSHKRYLFLKLLKRKNIISTASLDVLFPLAASASRYFLTDVMDFLRLAVGDHVTATSILKEYVRSSKYPFIIKDIGDDKNSELAVVMMTSKNPENESCCPYIDESGGNHSNTFIISTLVVDDQLYIFDKWWVVREIKARCRTIFLLAISSSYETKEIFPIQLLGAVVKRNLLNASSCVREYLFNDKTLKPKTFPSEVIFQFPWPNFKASMNTLRNWMVNKPVIQMKSECTFEGGGWEGGEAQRDFYSLQKFDLARAESLLKRSDAVSSVQIKSTWLLVGRALKGHIYNYKHSTNMIFPQY